VWHRWTTPATWGSWDHGLRSATLDGAFHVGATGRLVDLSGRSSRFTVRTVEPGRVCVVDVPLPSAVLRLTRTSDAGLARHEVAFAGPAAPLLALVLGARFRRLLRSTVPAVTTPSSSSAGPGG
jgi:hypothetical protein